MTVLFQEIESYKSYGRAIRISNDKVEIIVTLDIGPRIMHLSVPGKPSILEDECSLKETLPDGSVYNFFGGHRVWHSPEAYPRSYLTDNDPLESIEMLEDGIIMHQKEEAWTKIRKSIEVHLLENSVRVINHLDNRGAWPIEVAVWSLTIGSRGGREVCPVVQRNTGLLPNTAYVGWPYSRMNDPRVYWGQRYILVDNDPNDTTAFKFGYANELGWMAYFNHGQCFVKKYAHDRAGKYPDMGCSYETYTSYWGVELESLSPLKMLKPGKVYSHEEQWFVVESQSPKSNDEDEVAAIMQPIAEVSGIELPVVSSDGWDPTFEAE